MCKYIGIVVKKPQALHDALYNVSASRRYQGRYPPGRRLPRRRRGRWPLPCDDAAVAASPRRTRRPRPRGSRPGCVDPVDLVVNIHDVPHAREVYPTARRPGLCFLSPSRVVSRAILVIDQCLVQREHPLVPVLERGSEHSRLQRPRAGLDDPETVSVPRVLARVRFILGPPLDRHDYC